MKSINEIIAENLTALRAKSKMTQLELAQRLNYSDKSISKWEHGDATPGIDVLKELADIYGVTLDYLVTEFPEDNLDKVYNVKRNNPNKIIITLLAVLMVWLVAVIFYIYAAIFYNRFPWLIFVTAVPLCTVVLIVFNAIWGKRKIRFYLLSLLVWSLLATIFLFILTEYHYNFWVIFILGAPLQIAVVLWSQLIRTKDLK